MITSCITGASKKRGGAIPSRSAETRHEIRGVGLFRAIRLVHVVFAVASVGDLTRGVGDLLGRRIDLRRRHRLDLIENSPQGADARRQREVVGFDRALQQIGEGVLSR